VTDGDRIASPAYQPDGGDDVARRRVLEQKRQAPARRAPKM
jgi:hypothetical protein